ncbi:uncharacterized protein FTOL_11998 [Fusarium torulosum]|uniref:Uncharacterized protein n=1 Tax=Fusarium torulosum TaxID=33205 RepID=A0AAE8SNI0_9HYPO|nr:uncharacterized protein FTOL_11998 [Fusarium torulosum]
MVKALAGGSERRVTDDSNQQPLEIVSREIFGLGGGSLAAIWCLCDLEEVSDSIFRVRKGLLVLRIGQSN